MLKNIILMLLASALAALLLLRREVVPVPAPPEPPAPRFPELASLLNEARANPALAGAAVGFCLIDSKGEVVEEDHAETAFIPASSLKTLTTATALEILGPDFHFSTTLKATAPIEAGVLRGDLVIVGGGDPMLSMEDLETWAKELKKRGLRMVTGRVRGDARIFSGSLYGDFWNWGDIGNGYGSGVAGLNLNHNRYALAFRAGETVGSPATLLGISVDVPEVDWSNEVTTGAKDSGDGVVIHGGEKTNAIHLRGTVPLGAEKFGVNGAVPDPVRFATHQFSQILAAQGVQIGGGKVSEAEPKHELIKHDSPPLIEIIKSIHATSDNQETECVYRMLGVKAGKAPDVVIREHWKPRGLDFIGLRMEDGCGLARADFIRPLDLARLQFLAGTGPQGAAYKDSLLAKDGLRWKGGAMSGIRTYTGFAQSKSGGEFCYALMVNHYLDGKTVSEFSQRVMDAMTGL
ncbi:D-alanyl-D-alanine carboxypeptidase/D-alanyl-D-alanine-endopeptidase [Prosthecobacter sp.]|uniref:D-alanyl-D-alanine carboxypeptidase/D-alanyl-D-alanine endopeptidase n=1 Tax=Prosthecobacter sp. TaxID=1965333 RepID=UPI001DA35035|nr:D-alanyl-D-alanine carboxypeptidase/D-alanyl-D-alanine-endopeptidase [Prosthecobacter sp.]MCB1275855.1 D-alanyl-D-alanine carboxypeptidase/D-alanyl-D-alanine-endopeptidase [Prosthecobacter sp.]